ncbi:Fe2 /Zn2 regulated transporter [Ceraceosorus bombacis]|uniref:Fe2 /Zn2 regulated transporter n=1 Tax=Ceraceosorus bombacis TaxID=401625 RepID=A0A0P1BLC0_9BASI|nr:Fe2 /Zn2 regulated transporter [Ceraceosorus bombacis]
MSSFRNAVSSMKSMLYPVLLALLAQAVPASTARRLSRRALQLAIQARQASDVGTPGEADACSLTASSGNSDGSAGQTSLPLAIGGIFVILIASLLGTLIPLASRARQLYLIKRRSQTRKGLSSTAARADEGNGAKMDLADMCFFALRHIGTGVILSTAFIHLLYEAFESFQSPCFPELSFEPTSPAIAMGSLYLIFVLDFFLLRGLRRKAAAMNGAAVPPGTLDGGLCCTAPRLRMPIPLTDEELARPDPPSGKSKGMSGAEEDLDETDSHQQIAANGPSHQKGAASSTDRVQQHQAPINQPPSDDDILKKRSGPHAHDEAASASNSDLDAARAHAKVAKFEVIALEAGIIFHSVIIGVSLGASSGDTFVTLLIAMTFHQMFEGLALGGRIALLDGRFVRLSFKLLMAIAYSLTTPTGMAIGLGIRGSFSETASTSALAIGILNSISAGILLFTAMELMIADFVFGPLRDAPAVQGAAAAISLAVGAAGMAVVGNWA